MNDMFCFQCEQTAGGKGCTKVGVCGKKPDIANLQDEITAKLITLARALDGKPACKECEALFMDALFMCVTNVNFDAADNAAMVARIQNELFDVGADLCVPGEAGARLRVADTQSARLEAEIAAMNAALPPLRSFVLPAGCAGAAHAHLARTVVRRAERLAVALAAEEEVNPAVIRYLNRLSDHLFVLSRRLNAAAGGDVLWVPGATR